MRESPRRALTVLAALALVVTGLAGASCRREPVTVVPEVTLLSTVGAVPVQVLAAAVAQRGIAHVRTVDRIADADLLWAGDPTEILEAGAAVAAGAAPLVTGIDAKFRDSARRFAPLCARARVLVLDPRAQLPIEPRNLRDLADPRLAGRIALPPLSHPAQVTALAVLASVHGEASIGRFLDLLEKNRPLRGASDADVVTSVGRGDAALGLAGSEAAAAGALSAAGLEVLYPDQSGRGAVVVPTAVAMTTRGAGSAPARAVADYLVGPEGERLLVARVPGFMPLRADVPVPPGVRPAGNLVTLPLAWDGIVLERRKLLERRGR